MLGGRPSDGHRSACQGGFAGYNAVKNLGNLHLTAAGRDFRHLREHIEEILPLAHEVGFYHVCRAGFHVKLTLKVVMNEVDLHIGSRIRGRRLLLRRSVEAVAFLAGIEDETLLMFEEGQRRVPATDMVKLCEILDMRPLDIFRGYPYAEAPSDSGRPGPHEASDMSPDASA